MSAVIDGIRPNHAAWLGRGQWVRAVARAFSRTGPAPTAYAVASITAAGAVVFSFALAGGAAVLASPMVALVIAAAAAEAFPVPIERVSAGATSFANVFIVAAGTLYGWRAAAITGALTMLAVEGSRRQRPVKLAFNSSLYVLAGAAAGHVAAATPAVTRAAIGAGAFYVVDLALLAVVIACSERKPYLHVVRSFYASTFAPFLIMVAIASILVQLWRAAPYYALMLAPPLIAILAYQRSLIAAMARQRELDELKSEFIAVISHELRTPLTSVYGSAVTMEERTIDEETRAELIGIIRRESSRLAKLVEDVLWASRLEAKRTKRHVQAVDVGEVVGDVAATAAQLAPEAISVASGIESPLPRVSADPDELRRVLENLVENAVKYSPDGGTVGLSARAVEGGVRLSVSDEGIGIPQHQRERIFDRFVRLDPQMRTGIPGTGLGLYICHGLVRDMGGSISVAANGARGSVFTVDLPATTAEEVKI